MRAALQAFRGAPQSPPPQPRAASPAYVSIRQHSLAYVSRLGLSAASAGVGCDRSIACTRLHTSACVSIRQQTSANVSKRQLPPPRAASAAASGVTGEKLLR
jgi:hypothetical protein